MTKKQLLKLFLLLFLSAQCSLSAISATTFCEYSNHLNPSEKKGIHKIIGSASWSTASATDASGFNLSNKKQFLATHIMCSAYNNVLEDIIKGGGEYLDSLLALYNTNRSDKRRVVTQLQKQTQHDLSHPHYSKQTHSNKASLLFKSFTNATNL
ncbi:hypothetical protein DID76_01700 [Candidatus Marinamargulisbacteria bacterium SCGC AG-414-C22]|nr:hypothetical protein DID76_01700 [Candidatus Marinamargulisbacteria bacterium SCGC AG-414-C22]